MCRLIKIKTPTADVVQKYQSGEYEIVKKPGIGNQNKNQMISLKSK